MIPFKAACTSLTVAFQLFKPNGTPIRADVKLALTQAETATSASANSANNKTNPTTRSDGGLGVHVVRDGDTLQSIAHQTYGDPGRWRTRRRGQRRSTTPCTCGAARRSTCPRLD